jgi:hypothetical protein
VKVDIEKLLAQGTTLQLHPKGYSMYPMFVPGRDEAIIAPVEVEKLKRGDVVLYRRKNSILVLHRLCKKNKKGFYFVGDNQVEVEGPLHSEQMKGVLIGFIRKGRYISVKNPIYRCTSSLWLFLRPIRRCFQVPLEKMKKISRIKSS